MEESVFARVVCTWEYLQKRILGKIGLPAKWRLN